jgi:hypothetical protein
MATWTPPNPEEVLRYLDSFEKYLDADSNRALPEAFQASLIKMRQHSRDLRQCLEWRHPELVDQDLRDLMALQKDFVIRCQQEMARRDEESTS